MRSPQQVASVQVHVHVHSDGTVHHHVDKTSSATVTGEQPDRPKAGPAAKVLPRAIPTTEVAADRSGSSRVLPALGGSIAEPAAYHIQQPILTSCLVGCGPDRIDRPPIALLPM